MSFTRFKGNSCPVCGGDRKDKDCRRSDTTGLVHCRGRHIYDFVPGYECVGEDSIGFPMWSDGTGRAGPRRTSGPSQPQAPKPAFDPAKHFSEYINADRTSRPFHTRLEADELFVTELGLPSWAVDCMTWSLYTDSFNRYCWTCREWGLVDGQVVPVGRHFRYPGGSKRTYGNPLLPDNVSKRGVFQPTEWWDESGPVYLPEGASDAVTIKVMGYPAIGRPNNGPGGVDAACHLVEQRTPGRDVWVLIENDQKPDGRWPALEGGRQAAALAAKLLGRPVLVVAPPPQHKDVRAYFKAYQAAGLSVARIADYWLDAAVIVEAFEPGEQAPPVAVVPPQESECAAERDYSDLERFEPARQDDFPDLYHEEELAADRGRFALPPLPPCSYTLSLRHRTENRGRVVGASCGRWACPHCAPFLRKEWKAHVASCLGPLVADVYVGNCEVCDWPKVYRQIQRRGGRFARCIDGDCYLVVATTRFVGAFTLPPSAGLDHLREAIDRFPPCRKPIFTCKAWRKPEPEQSGDWKLDAKLSFHSTLPRCTEILREAGIEPTIKIPSGQEQRRRYLEFDFPSDTTESQVNNVFMCLWMGEWIPDTLSFAVDAIDSPGSPADLYADVFPD